MSKHGGKEKAALQAGMDPKTGLKYRKAGKLPSEMRPPPRSYLTRPDPFAADWPWLSAMLADVPELEAKTLFEHLQGQRPGAYEPGQVRTFQRHVARWRAQHGPEREVFFAQEHRPGEFAQTDFTWCNELKITIGGALFQHMLCHVVLPYSNWQWATVCLSESLLALRRGIQAALFRLGRKPAKHQTDNSTAATHDLRADGQGKGKRAFNDEYLDLMRHFAMEPHTIGIGESEQNGDVEAANGALKRRLEQYLLLRGSRDFESVQAYETWVQSKCDAGIANRTRRLCEELAAMRPVAAARVREHDELVVAVSTWSTIRVKDCVSSVPSRMIGQDVRVRVSERWVEVWFAGRQELQAERLLGRTQHRVDYRHVIWSLVRKPNAFARYRYREDLFPTLAFRRAYDRLRAVIGHEKRTDIAYLRLLHLEAGTLQADVEAGIEILLEQGEAPTLCEGGFADRAENVLIFGLPGRGKTHLGCAIGHELVLRGMTVLFVPVFKLVQRLLTARRDLKMERELHRLDAFDVLIIDDIGYIQQDRDEMEVLFTLLAERYERRSVVITSNLVFSQWDRIFKDPMTTAAAVDRMVHHSIILEMNGPSFRTETALAKQQEASFLADG